VVRYVDGVKSRAHKSIAGTGRVKFWKADKGWGGIESDDVPSDVWVPFGAIESPGYRGLTEGQRVEFRCRAAEQDSWHYVATWVRTLDPA
jgi:CspA family cold shock protein